MELKLTQEKEQKKVEEEKRRKEEEERVLDEIEKEQRAQAVRL
jgi:hypothetical protein